MPQTVQPSGFLLRVTSRRREGTLDWGLFCRRIDFVME